MPKKTAIILGATGLTGSLLLEKLIADDRYESIVLFSRKSTGNTSPKVTEHVGEVLHLHHFKDNFKADDVFCCIGTTAAKTKDKTQYKAIDYGIPLAAAQLSKENNISNFAVISALGADTGSSIFYNRTKGEMEDAVRAENIENTYIFQPSLIVGNRNEIRFGEKFAYAMMKLFGFLLVGKLKKYKPIQASTIASAMILVMNSNHKSATFASDNIQKLSMQQSF